MFGKCHLSDSASCFRNACHLQESRAHTIIHFFDFYAAHFCFVTNEKASLLVDISLMVPTKSYINNVWFIFTIEFF